MPKLTIPAAIVQITPSDEERLRDLFRRFGSARRRAYALKQRGASKSEVEKILQQQIGINARYAKDAHHSVKNLPPHVTFGGLKLQRLREAKKITIEEYKKRKNSLVISRGEKPKLGNLNMRIIYENSKLMLRINVPPERELSERWIYPEIFVPEKYLKHYGHLLDGESPYTVMLKRRNDDRGYDVRVIIEMPLEKKPEPKRVMALDLNAGHVDFAVAEKERVIAVGKINCHEVQHASTNKTNNLLHKTANKIRNIAKHYGARVVYGRLNTQKFKGSRGSNREIKRIPHHKLGSILNYKCNAERRSEAYTSVLGKKISPLVGLDVRKCSAAAFALKVLNYKKFKASSRSSSNEIFSRGVTLREGDGSPRRWLSAGSGLTAPAQGAALSGDEVALVCNGGHSAIPGSGGLSFMESLKTNLPYLDVRVC